MENYIEIIRPSRKEVEYYLNEWDSLENYTLQESSLRKLFLQTYPLNEELNDVLVKVCVLNQFYGTQIRKVFNMAKHIKSLNIDDDLRTDNLDLVEKIAIGHKIHKDENAKESYLYSFATKYCSHHKPSTYPIYDYYVEKMLLYCKGKDSFDTFTTEDLKSYERFREILLSFTKFYSLTEFNLKQIDKYLWQAGKRYFPRNYKKSESKNMDVMI